ncbi:protein cholesin isoform X1 [Ictidomys tridecemlineatus]|uniref:uncharacterized protein C7orf50 homolog n=1 Tax=Ictidomys tridecemlineatus TaxID=43179 RepID=UPI001A9D0DA8|nr:uncharacterized protein C7orf50 homolog [Ictidomys tridecemlineatus]
MAKQKRKGPEVTAKKSKKVKKASAEERPQALETTADNEEASPKSQSCLLFPSPHISSLQFRRGRNGVPPIEGEAASRVQAPGPELSPEERRVLERKLKKERKKEEKKRLREAGSATAQTPPARRSGAELALDYLRGWAQKHKNWKFQKTRQTWLLLHMYDSDKVPDEHFSTLLAYLEGLKGRARELTVQKAEALIQELDEAGSEAALLEKAQRLRQVLQLLS